MREEMNAELLLVGYLAIGNIYEAKNRRSDMT
jgi:hypothetical protein